MEATPHKSEIGIWLQRLNHSEAKRRRYYAVGGSINETIDATSGKVSVLPRHARDNRRVALLQHAILNHGRKTVSGRMALLEYYYLRDYET